MSLPLGLASSSKTTGALVVSGGIGVSGNSCMGAVTAADSMTCNGMVTASSVNCTGVVSAVNLTSTGQCVISGPIYATSSSSAKTTGALVVSGGIGASGTSYMPELHVDSLYISSLGMFSSFPPHSLQTSQVLLVSLS